MAAVPLFHWWAYLAWQVGIVACRVSHWLRSLLSVLHQHPRILPVTLKVSHKGESFLINLRFASFYPAAKVCAILAIGWQPRAMTIVSLILDTTLAFLTNIFFHM